MELEAITVLAKAWDEKTCAVLNLDENILLGLEEILRDTFAVLYNFRDEKTVPKEVCQMLLNMDEFMYFLSMMGDKEEKLSKTFYVYRALHCVVKDMKRGFFDGKYDDSFPVLKVTMDGKIYEVNMDGSFLEGLVEV